ncbi:hypothetical protein AZI87_13270 [Bdellovibrio bacteriovorus]|uniref:Sodium:proton antiporter n=1 Tax=Bdellovibrio bacteriovorus TaxID=959 RepID=A0A162G357_BDEBC|nr:hypothetical protein [Bdellovibrio bacteriovorus]KYG64209.1 hypothetical protein AZI87_13270 [Bdellovibrio bacteriovorus]
MKRVILLSALLLAGLVLSQVLPLLLSIPVWVSELREFITMVLLAYIMIEVGREFEINLKKKREYGWDYFVAATAAAFPWIFCSLYFYWILMPGAEASEKGPLVESLLVGRFAAPTSAGVLFSMLAAAGLASTWAFKKTRILAIFDDLDTVLLMIPLKVIIAGFVWQLGVDLVAIAFILIAGVKLYRKVSLPTSWPWVLLYSFSITAMSEGIYFLTKDPVTTVGSHIEVLLPAFVLGCIFKPSESKEEITTPGEDTPGSSDEETVGLIVSSAFMFLVGLSMPAAFGERRLVALEMGVLETLFHVVMITLLANIGKLFAAFCYRKEATFKERLAVSISLFPRGEVGAGVLAVSLSYGITGAHVTIGFLSLALNLILTGVFILIVKKLLEQKNIEKRFEQTVT